MKIRIIFSTIFFSLSSLIFAGTQVPDDLANLATSINKDLPKKVDNITTFTSVSVDATTLHYHYRISKKAADFNIKKAKDSSRKNLASLVCSSDLHTKLFARKINIEFDYTDQNGLPLWGIVFKQGDCKK